MKRLLCKILFLAVLAVTRLAAAEFINPSETVWGDNFLKVIKTFSPAGFFIVVSKTPINPLNFDLARLTTSTVSSLFIAFDKGRFSSLTMQDGSVVGVSGSFVLVLSEAYRIAVSNDPVSPYITFEHRSKDVESLLGFLGLDLVINASSKDVAAKFSAAAPLVERFEKAVRPFVLRLDGGLELNGEPLVAKRLGLRFSIENPCSSTQAVFRAVAGGVVPRESLVPLMTMTEAIVAMDTRKDNSFVRISFSPERSECVLSPLVP
jgi:hypothetical protein